MSVKNMNTDECIQALNSSTAQTRLDALAQLKYKLDNGQMPRPDSEGLMNNHVHTIYSFSPYSPAMTAWKAYEAGLCTVGIMDHDSVGGAQEFIRAGRTIGIATTVGFEMRTDWSETPMKGKRLNNPDQVTSGYITVHGLPQCSFAAAEAYLAPLRAARNQRTRRMISRLNEIIRPLDLLIDFDADVLPLSMAAEGGGVTERHMLFALAKQLIARFGAGNALAEFVRRDLKIPLNTKQRAMLTDPSNSVVAYDLLGVLKGYFVSQIFIDARKDEAPDVAEVVLRAKAMGAIPTYCYLGDVGESPTGDKAAQKFEDDYLDEVFAVCRDLGFDAVSFMPTRNTSEQLQRVMRLCREYGFMQISGEDINQPRQSFVCRELLKPEFRHLNESSWALVGHEMEAAGDISRGMFQSCGRRSAQDIDALVERYARTAKEAYHQ